MSDNFRVIRFFILRRRKGYIYKKRDILSRDAKSCVSQAINAITTR